MSTADLIAGRRLTAAVVDAESTPALLDVLVAVASAPPPVTAIVCGGLAELILDPQRAPGTRFGLQPVGVDVDTGTVRGPEHTGEVLAARYVTAWANSDRRVFTAAFDGVDVDDVTYACFLATLAFSARAALLVRVMRDRAAQS